MKNELNKNSGENLRYRKQEIFCLLVSGGNFARRLQNLSCAFAQIAIKDFAYRKQEVFCLLVFRRKLRMKKSGNFYLIKFSKIKGENLR